MPSNSRIVNIGNSYEGRQIYGIHLWGTSGQGSRPVIYFHGTVHAREWISAAVGRIREMLRFCLLSAHD